MAFKESINRASRLTNLTLGVPCVYTVNINGSVIPDVYIYINHNKEVKDDFGMIAGYRVEANILKSDVALVRNDDTFVDPDGIQWRINMITKETISKWYVDVVQL